MAAIEETCIGEEGGTARSTVRDLYDDYVALLDDRQFDQWLELFVPGCVYLVVSEENDRRGLPLATMRCDSRAMLSDRLDAIRNTQFFAPRAMRHFVSGIQVSVHPEGFQARANFLVTETIGADPTNLHMTGRYRDLIVIEQRRARFAAKVAVYDAAIVPTSLIFPL